MNDELEAIKQRAAGRGRKHGYYIDPDGDFAREELAQAEDDLDRAIEIAEEERETKELGQRWLADMQRERDGHYENYLMWHARHGDRREERDQARADYATALEAAKAYKEEWIQARADVLKLRDVLSNLYAQEHEFFPPGTWDEAQERTVSALADTEHYEKYR